MSDATEAWEEWAEAFDILVSQGVPIDRRTTFIAGHKAGFAAGQVAALEDAAEEFQKYAESDRNEAKSKQDDDPDRHYWEGCAEANAGRATDLRARVAELKEQHDQPDA